MSQLCSHNLALECHDIATCNVTTGGCVRARQAAIEHPAQAKQRLAMHERVAADAKLFLDDIAQRRREAEQRDARRNQPITRGELLDAIDATMLTRGGAEVGLLRALREAFE